MSNPPEVPAPAGKDDATPNRFGPQCFLLDFWKQFVYKNVKTTYRHYVKLNGNPSIAINKLLDKRNGFPLNDLTPAQQAMLVPKFRLYKVFKDGGCSEFEFDDFTSLESITKSNLFTDPRGRPSAAGFKSFQWEDLGSNPASQGVSFKANLTLTFANMESLFRVQPNGLSFADLVVPQGKKKTDENPLFEAKEHRIKVDIGWHVPVMNDAALWGDSTRQKILRKAITSSSMVLLLNLTTHELDIKEDGGIDLTLEYIAAVEGGLMSPRSDIFYLGETNEDDESDNVKREEEVLKELQGQEKELIAAGHQGDIWDDKVLNDKQTEVENQEKKIKNLKMDKADKKEKALLDKYNKLMTAITAKGRFFIVELSPDDQEMYKRLNKLYHAKDSKGKPLSSEEIIKQRTVLVKDFRINNGTGAGSPTSGNPPGDFDMAAEYAKAAETSHQRGRITGGLGFDNRAENVQDETEKAEKAIAKAKLVEDNRINWFFLGDLLQAGFETVHKQQAEDKDDKNSIWRYIVGTISMWDADTNKFYDVNIADLPICWEYFQSFWLKKVIKPMREKYNIRDFVNDLISELLLGSLSPTCFGKMQAQIKTRLNSQTLSLPVKARGGKEDPIPVGGVSYLNADAIGNKMRDRWGKPVICSKTAKQDYRQYWYVYGSGFNSANLKGVQQDDEEKNGIVHLKIGAPSGLLKTVKFKRQDMPGQREANISKASEGGTSGNLMFSDKYNASLSLFGNLLFKNGMMAYVDTTGLGIGKPSQVGSAARKMGIGGYYRVIKVSNSLESGKFETTLETKLEGLGEKNMKSKNKNESMVEPDPDPNAVGASRGRGAPIGGVTDDKSISAVPPNATPGGGL